MAKPIIRVFVSVVGDLFHVGHLNFLHKAKKLGDYLIVGVLTDEIVKSYKRKPIIPENERFGIIGNLSIVDRIFIQDTLEPDHDFLKNQVDIIAHGDDWKDNFPGAEYMRGIGKRAINIPYYKAQSTTKIKERIRGLSIEK